MKLVLDTNVLVSGMINPAGPPGVIVDRVRAGMLTLLVDDRMLDEYARVLQRPRFERYFSSSQVRDVIGFLHTDTDHLVASVRIDALPDPDDAPFLEVALTAGAPLVTGNLDHLPSERCRGAEVLRPAEYVKKYLVA